MSLPVAGVGGCTELSASPPSQESLRRLPWCTCVSASARQSRAQCCAREFCCKILFLDQLSNKLSHAQHLDEVTWTTKNWHGLQMQRLSVVLHTAVAWQTVNELACGDSGIAHGAKCMEHLEYLVHCRSFSLSLSLAVLNGVA